MPGTFTYRQGTSAAYTTITSMDSDASSWSHDMNVVENGNNFTSGRKQGTNIVEFDTGTGEHYMDWNTGAGSEVNLQAEEISFWFLYTGKASDVLGANSNSFRLRVYSDVTAGTNWAEWELGGHETAGLYAKIIKEWNPFLISGENPTLTNGTTPNYQSIRHIRFVFDIANSNTSNNPDMAMDWLKHGDRIRVTGGTSGSPADLPSMADWSAAVSGLPEYGLVFQRDIYFDVWAGWEVGDGSTATYAASENEVYYNYQFSEAVSHDIDVLNGATLRIGKKDAGDDATYAINGSTLICPVILRDLTTFKRYSDIRITGNATKANAGKIESYASRIARWHTVEIGDTNGTNDSELIETDFDGNLQVLLKDANLTITDCKFHDAFPTELSSSSSWIDDNGSYTDITTNWNNTTTQIMFPATEVAGQDRHVFGYTQQFGAARFDLSTAGVGGTVTWEYYNGSTWSALTVEDGTNGFTEDGWVTWRPPSDWATTQLQSEGQRYYVRAEIATLYSTNPVMTQGWIGQRRIGEIHSAPSSVSGMQVFNADWGPHVKATMTLTNVEVTDVSDSHFVLDSAVTLTLRNSTFDKDKLRMASGTGTQPTEYSWDPTVNRTSTGAAISGIDVHVWDGATTPVKVVNGLTTGADGSIASQWLEKESNSVTGYTTTTTAKTPHIARFVKFGEIAIEFQQNIQAGTTPTFYTDTQSNLTETTKATVLAYNGITVTHGSDLVTLATGAATRVDDMNKLYDYLQAEAEDSPQLDTTAGNNLLEILSTVDKTNYLMYYDLVVNNVSFDGQDRAIAFQGTTDLTLQGASVSVTDLAITGDVNLGTSTGGISLSNLDCTGAMDFSVAGTYNLTDCQVNEVTNSSGGAVTLNLLGDSSVTLNTGPSITINNAVTIRIKTIDSESNPVDLIRCAIYKTSDDSDLMNEDSNASGIAEESFNYLSDTPIYWRVRESPAGGDRYKAQSGVGTITSSGFEVTVTMRPETVPES